MPTFPLPSRIHQKMSLPPWALGGPRSASLWLKQYLKCSCEVSFVEAMGADDLEVSSDLLFGGAVSAYGSWALAKPDSAPGRSSSSWTVSDQPLSRRWFRLR